MISLNALSFAYVLLHALLPLTLLPADANVAAQHWHSYDDYEWLDLRAAQNTSAVDEKPMKIREPEDDVNSLWQYEQLMTNVDGGDSDDENDPHRVVGGQKISISQTPWQVAIYANGVFFCGGSILTHRWVLSAGHCVAGKVTGKITIRAGSNNVKRYGQVRTVVKIVKNRKFKLSTMNHDVSLLQVAKPFKYNKRVQPVRLPKPNSPYRPRTYLVSGWGLQAASATNIPLHLHAAYVNYFDKEVCRVRYQNRIIITRYMFCAAAPGRDGCSGDSGGCLTYDGICYGIVSFGIGCASPYYPGVYSDVARLVDWIKRAIKAHS